MITVEDVVSRIRRQMRGKLPADQVIEAGTGLDDLGMSSLQVSEAIFTLEEEYGFEFDPARAADVRTVGDVVVLANESLVSQG